MDGIYKQQESYKENESKNCTLIRKRHIKKLSLNNLTFTGHNENKEIEK